VLALIAADAAGATLHAQAAGYSRHHAHVVQVIRAAKHGNVRAQARLAWMYSTGFGVPQDYIRAAKWYYRAAKRGHGGAQFQLGLLHNKGQGVERDLVRAYMWLNRSASQAVGEDRDFKVRIRDAIASKMTIAEIAVAQQLSSIRYAGPQR
jgi:TPR repeat protein